MSCFGPTALGVLLARCNATVNTLQQHPVNNFEHHFLAACIAASFTSHDEWLVGACLRIMTVQRVRHTIQEQERREDAAIPKRKDELQALVARLSAAEDAKQERYKALAARLRLLKTQGVRGAAAAS